MSDVTIAAGCEQENLFTAGNKTSHPILDT